MRINSNSTIPKNPSFLTHTPKLYSRLPKGPAGPPAPNPSQKTGGLIGLTLTKGVTFDGSNKITNITDQTGNGRDAVFASGQEAMYVPAYINGQAAAQLLSTTLGTMSTDNLIALGSARGIYMVIQNTTEAGTFYHSFVLLRTATANSNFDIVYSNDPSYNFFFGVVAGISSLTMLPSIVADITTNAASFILNWDGVSGEAPSSFDAYINNSVQVVASGTGVNNNAGNGNYINSYGATPPPVFPATNCYLMEFWLFDSLITPTERATIFKPYTQTTYGITQA